jgi:hypothetical protein
MSIPPESIQVGKCYLTTTGQVRRVIRIMPNGRVQYEHRLGHAVLKRQWPSNIAEARTFAFAVEREVPCDWTPERDGA